jgi:hypothetical protein
MTDMAELSKVLRYDAESGQFFWINQWSRSGKIAGSLQPTGYIAIGVGGRKYLAHRLAWLFTYGVWPTGILDHKDRNKTNNKISNLRDTNQSVNQLNREPKPMRGVSYHQGRWKARKAGKYIGMFSTPEEAAAAYEAYNV